MSRRNAAMAVVWAALLFWARFGINALVFVAMARWISAGDIGAYGAAFAVIQIFQVALTTGLPETVIQQQSLDEKEISTAFWLSLGIGAVLSLVCLAMAPAIGLVTGSDLATQYMMALAVLPVVIGFGAVSEGIIRKGMDTRRLALRTTLALSAAGLVALWLAYDGWGGWAFVGLTVVNNVLASLLNVALAPWRPSLRFMLPAVGPLLRIAVQITGRNLLKAAINPSSQLIVTLILGITAGGTYLVATRFVTILSSLTLMPAQFAALPIFARVRNDTVRRRRAFIDAVSLMSAVTSPTYIGVCAIAPILMPILFGNNGMSAVGLIQGLLFHSPVLVLANLAIPALVSVGMARVTLHLTLIQAILNVPLTTIAALISLDAVGWSYGFLYYLIMPLIIRAISRGIGTEVRSILRAAFMPWLASMSMGAIVSLYVQYHNPPHTLQTIAIAMALGLFLYPPLLFLFARNHFALVVSLRTRLRHSNRNDTSSHT